MNKRKLELYENLFKRLGPGTHSITLSAIAESLNCSDRHARTLLKQMSERGWLTWLPARGRGLRGALTCILEPLEACYREVDLATEQGNYDVAHKLISFNDRNVATALKQYLTHTTTVSENTIHAPFHRRLSWLHPHHAMERTERHLIHEVFQTLVSSQGEDTVGNLAHGWEANSNFTNWHFYLRSGASFHDQTPITTADVIESLQGLVQSVYWCRLYDHIEAFIAHSPHQLEIQLNQSDPSFLALLSRSEASIMPKGMVHRTESSFRPIGSGPYFVEVNSDKLLRLTRNNEFSGKTALVQHIELWIHEDWAADKKCAENFFFLNEEEDTYTASTADIGYFFLLLNHRELQTSSFKHQLEALFSSEQAIHLECPAPLTFSFENNNENRAFATKLHQGLSLGGIEGIGTQVVYGHPAANQSLAIGGIRLEGDRATSLFAFFKLYPYWDKALTWKQQDKLRQSLSVCRATTDARKRETLLDRLLLWLYQDNILAIIKSEDLTLTLPSRIRGVEINSIGWCDFAQLWIKAKT
ncbi:SgrR family transcriptional regulator [Vibrio maritimus]|uniref:SgrR family transcriptional regulator n=1 Tax=Vibrio maritimus TaxID=990268 RepID=UPI0040679291